MHLGFTFDLRDEYLAEGYGETETAEFDRPDTIDAIERALRDVGHTVDRIGRAARLVERLAAGTTWDLVFNICEGLRGIARESQVPSILEVFDIPYTFSDPVVMGLCLHKGHAKTIVERAGIPTASYAVVSSMDDCGRITTPFPLFAKPIAEGTGKGVNAASVIASRDELRTVCRSLLGEFRQSVLVERYLPGREFTVGLVGTGFASRVLGTLEIVLLPGAESGVYSYVNKEACEELVEYRLVLPDDDPEVARAEQLARDAWLALGCRDGGRIDVRSDAEGRPHFLEANPLPGLHPHHSDLPILATAVGIPFHDLIGCIVDSAAERR